MADLIPMLSAPVVLAHGLRGFDRIFACRRPGKECFPGIRRGLEAAGNRVLTARVGPTAGIAARAAQLKAFIRREVGTTPVHVIGHSMGGLDARHMISRLGMDRQVLSLTTVGTPHRGTAFADWGVRRLARFVCPVFRAARVSSDAFFDLTTDACRRFNERVPDAPTVRSCHSPARRIRRFGQLTRFRWSPVQTSVRSPHVADATDTSPSFGPSDRPTIRADSRYSGPSHGLSHTPATAK